MTAVKLGAFDYLAKPVNADEVAAALAPDAEARPEQSEHPMSADRARWEHIQRVYRVLRTQRLGDGAPAQHAPADAPAHPGQTRAKVSAGA